MSNASKSFTSMQATRSHRRDVNGMVGQRSTFNQMRTFLREICVPLQPADPLKSTVSAALQNGLMFQPHSEDELFQMSNWTGRPKVRKHGGMAQSVEHIVHIDGVVGSSPTVTTTNPVGVQVQRLPDFFAYPSRVRTFRSQEYALFCQRGTQKGYTVHLKTAYPWKHFVHIHRDALANFRFFHQKHKQLTSSFSFEFRMPNRKKFQKIINTHLVAVL